MHDLVPEVQALELTGLLKWLGGRRYLPAGSHVADIVGGSANSSSFFAIIVRSRGYRFIKIDHREK